MPKVSPASDSSSISEVIPHSRPTLGAREQEAISQVLASGQLAQGPEVRALEDETAGYFNRSESVAVGSGSQALLLAIKSLGLGQGSRIAIPAFTCSAVLYAVEWSGAEPVLLDVASGELAPSPSTIDDLSDPVDAVIVVHPWGYPLEAAAWKSVAPLLIEDCAQSIGAYWANHPAGSQGDATIISFYATKMLCAGEGGVVATASSEIAEKVRNLRDYDGRSDYQKRFNFKMTDLQAALARVQLSRLPEFLEKRKEIAARYDSEVPAFGLTPVKIPPAATCSYYRYLCRIRNDVTRFLEFCHQNGVHCRRPVPITLDRLLHLPPLPNSFQAWKGLVSLPIYPTLSFTEQERVLEILQKADKVGLLN